MRSYPCSNGHYFIADMQLASAQKKEIIIFALALKDEDILRTNARLWERPSFKFCPIHSTSKGRCISSYIPDLCRYLDIWNNWHWRKLYLRNVIKMTWANLLGSININSQKLSHSHWMIRNDFFFFANTRDFLTTFCCKPRANDLGYACEVTQTYHRTSLTAILFLSTWEIKISSKPCEVSATHPPSRT